MGRRLGINSPALWWSIVAAGLAVPAAMAAEHVVGNGPGEYPFIQLAIDVARDGDEILVSSGTWYESIDLQGKALWLGPLDGEVILDAAGSGTVITCVNGEDGRTIIEGLTIRGGLADYGAGLLTFNSSPVLVDCVFEANEAIIDGGAWLGQRSDPTFIDCLFLGNSAGDGAALSCSDECSPLVLNCRFNGNCPPLDAEHWLLSDAMNIVAPLADTCEQAVELHDGTTPFATVCATTERPGHVECELAGDGGVIASDIWYRYTPVATGLLRLSTCRRSDFDTDLAVYAGRCDSLELIGCNDDAPDCPGGPSELLLPVQAGTEYMVRLGGGVEDAAGTGAIEVELAPEDDPDAPRGGDMSYIQGLVDAAGDGDTVTVPNGTWIGTLDMRYKSITLAGSDPFQCILRGDGTGPVIQAGYGDFTISNVGILNGNNTNLGHGGGLALTGFFDAVIDTCWFHANAGYLGGGIGTFYHSPAYHENTLHLQNCVFGGNTANSGGAVYVEQVQYFTADDCFFYANAAEYSGGAVHFDHWHNMILAPHSHLRRCILMNNTAPIGGGVMIWGNSWNSSENSAIFNNCLITGNSDRGIYSYKARCTIIHSTIAQNATTSSLGGGGVFLHESVGPGYIEPRIVNSILAGNTANTGFLGDHQFATLDWDETVDIEYSIVENHPWNIPAHVLDGSPHFVNPLGNDNAPGTGDEDYRLLEGSIAIDSALTGAAWLQWPYGDGTYQTANLDLDGNTYRYDDPIVPNTGVQYSGWWGDMGCYEFAPPFPGEPRTQIWTNNQSGTTSWNSAGNWAGSNGPPGTSDHVIFNSNWYDLTAGSPTSINANIKRLMVTSGTWNLTSSTLELNDGVSSLNIGLWDTGGGVEDAELHLGSGFDLVSNGGTVDGTGQGLLELSGAGTTLQLDQSGDRLRLVNGGRLVIDDQAVISGGGRLENVGGVLEIDGSGSAADIDVDYTGAGTYGEDIVAGGYLELDVINENQWERIEFNGDVILGGTISINAANASSLPDGEFELLWANSISGNCVMEGLELGSDRVLKVRKGANLRGGESLFGEITTISDIFGLNETQESSADDTPTDAALSDIDDDGDLDLLFTLPGTPGSLYVITNNGIGGAGNFWNGFETGASIQLTVGDEPSALDVSGSRVAVANKAGNSITLFEDVNNPVSGSTYNLDVVNPSLEPGPVDVCFFDVELDGFEDILVACEGDSTLRILADDGSRALGEDPPISLPDGPPSGIAPGDVDPGGDKDEDVGVLITSRTGTAGGRYFKRPAGVRGGGSIFDEDPQIVQLGAEPVGQSSGDIDNNGTLDFVVINAAGDSFSIVITDASGVVTSSSEIQMTGSSTPSSIDLGDFDADGDLDIVVILVNESGDTTARIWRNDLDNGFLSFNDSFEEPASNGTPAIVLAGDVDNHDSGGGSYADDVVILTGSTAIRGTTSYITPSIDGPVLVDSPSQFISVFNGAADGTTIYLAPGTYPLASSLDFGNRDLQIIGDADGRGEPTTIIISPSGQRAFIMPGGQTSATRLENLVIDGQGAGSGISFASGANPGPLVVNCVIRNCVSNYGGGCHISYASPRFEQCWFADNTAAETGGAVHMGHTSASFIDCVFVRNHADRGGAVMASSECDPLFDGCSFGLSTDAASGNSADGSGGAMFLDYGLDSPPCLVTDCDFFSNYAGTGGGAIRVYHEDAILTGCRFGLEGSPSTGNTTSTPSYTGGAVTAYDGSLDVSNCQFHHNLSHYGGGVFVDNCHQSMGHSVTLQSCQFTNNDAASGGGFCGYDSTITINDTDFDANKSTASNGAGGAVYVRSVADDAMLVELTMTDCTLTRNSAENTGGALWTDVADVVLDSCTFGDPDDATAGNSSPHGWGGAVRFYNVAGSSNPFSTICSAAIRGGGFYDNHADVRGGAIYYKGMPLTIEPADDGSPCVFRGNTTGAGTSETAESDRGGAISIDDGSFAAEHGDGSGPILTATGVIFENNSTEDQWGGALYLHDVETEFTDCTFTGNNATIGGAIRCYRRTTTLTNCDFIDNYARVQFDGSTYGVGGAISSDDSAIVATGCTFTGNESQDKGGAIWMQGADMTCTDCAFTGNMATHLDPDTWSVGGAIYAVSQADDGTMMNLVVLDSTFDSNEGSWGGAVRNEQGVVQISNSTFTNNHARGSNSDGGALDLHKCGVVLYNSTFDSNTANHLGGAISLQYDCWEPLPAMQNLQLLNNTADRGGAVFIYDGSVASMHGCTVTGNTSTDGETIWNHGTSPGVLSIGSSTICDNGTVGGEPTDPISGAWTDLGDNCISAVCDSDADGTPDCNDLCPNDPDKIEPGVCGCGIADDDSDGDGTVDCLESSCPSDVDGSGTVDVIDLLEVISNWGDCNEPAGCASDINENGTIDVLDLLEVISNWGPCP